MSNAGGPPKKPRGGVATNVTQPGELDDQTELELGNPEPNPEEVGSERREGQIEFGRRIPEPTQEPDGNIAFNRPTPQDDEDEGTAFGFGLNYRVVTIHRLRQLGLTDNVQREDASRKAMLANGNPFSVFMPCFQLSIEELTTHRDKFTDPNAGPITIEHIRKALGIIEDEDTSNWDFSNELRNIHPRLDEYLYYVLYNQYGRASIAGENFSDTSSEPFWTYSSRLKQSLDLGAVLFNNLKGGHLRGEMLATMERMIQYDGIKYEEDPANPTSAFKLVYSAPGSVTPITLFEAKAEQKVDSEGSYKLSIKFGPALEPDEFAKALRHALAFCNQYTQHSFNNMCPITKLSSSPEQNILLVLIAVGEYNLHIPRTMLEPPPDGTASIDMVAKINEIQDPDRRQQMLDLWNWAKERSELMQPRFRGAVRKLNPNVVNALASDDPGNIHVNGKQISDRDGSVSELFREKMQEALDNGTLRNVTSKDLFPTREAQPQTLAPRARL